MMYCKKEQKDVPDCSNADPDREGETCITSHPVPWRRNLSLACSVQTPTRVRLQTEFSMHISAEHSQSKRGHGPLPSPGVATQPTQDICADAY